MKQEVLKPSSALVGMEPQGPPDALSWAPGPDPQKGNPGSSPWGGWCVPLSTREEGEPQALQLGEVVVTAGTIYLNRLAAASS